jgi:hypothetical protein
MKNATATSHDSTRLLAAVGGRGDLEREGKSRAFHAGLEDGVAGGNGQFSKPIPIRAPDMATRAVLDEASARHCNRCSCSG